MGLKWTDTLDIAIALVWGLGLMLLLGALGGWWMSQRMARRIEAINRTSREIIHGDLSRRMPLQGTDDELDRLSGSLNQMLDRIQSLMEDVRRVSDNIAHDLRTPLGRLHNDLDGLRSELLAREVDTTGVDRALSESQALLATFNALQRRGVPSRLLYFPDENHWVLKPHNSILWHDTVIGWLDRWTAP